MNQFGRRVSDRAPIERRMLVGTFILSAIVVVTAVAATLYYVFAFKSPHPSTYQIVIILLFFALSTVSSLLFASQARLQGNIAGFTVTIAGPATLWIIGLFIFFKLFPYQDIFSDPFQKPFHLERMVKILHEIESKQNWKDYWSWKSHVSSYKKLFVDEEPNTLEKFLAAAYHEDEKAKTVKPHIITAFLYLDNNVLKLQRVKGDKEETQLSSFIRFRSRPSKAGAESKSVLLVGNYNNNQQKLEIGENYTEFTAPIESGYSEVFKNKIDCLIITKYDDPRDEDFFMVNMKRFSRHSSGTIDIGVFGYNWRIRNSSFWLMKPSMFLGGGEVPLYFMNLRTRESNTDRIREGLVDWLKLVDSNFEESDHNKTSLNPKVYQKLVDIRQLLRKAIHKSVTYSNVLEYAPENQKHAFHVEDTSYTALVLASFSQ